MLPVNMMYIGRSARRFKTLQICGEERGPEILTLWARDTTILLKWPWFLLFRCAHNVCSGK